MSGPSPFEHAGAVQISIDTFIATALVICVSADVQGGVIDIVLRQPGLRLRTPESATRSTP